MGTPNVSYVTHEAEGRRGGHAPIPDLDSWQADEQVPGGFVSITGGIESVLVEHRPDVFGFGGTIRSFLKDTHSLLFSARLVDPQPSNGKTTLVGKGWASIADRTIATPLLYQAAGTDQWATADNQDYQWSTTLTNTISNAATSATLDINGVQGLPTSGRFRLKIDNEIIVCDNVTSGNGVTSPYVVHFEKRGADGGSKAVQHLAGATVDRLLDSPDILGSIDAHRLSWHVNAHRSFNADDSETGMVFWAPGNDITRIAGTITVARDDANYSVIIRGGVGPSGKLEELQTYSLANVGHHLAFDYKLAGSSHYDIVYLALRRLTAGKKQRAFRAEVADLRVNGIADGDVFTTSDLARDLAARMGVSDRLIDDTTTNVLPLYVQSGSYADILTEAAAIEGWRWVVIDEGHGPVLDFGPWSRRTWVLTDPNATYLPVPVDRYNVVQCAFSYPSGATGTAESRPSPDELAPDELTYQISLQPMDGSSEQPSQEYAQRLCEAVLDSLYEPHSAGTASAAWVEKLTGEKVSSHHVHAGDLLLVGPTRHRIKTCHRTDGPPQWEFDDGNVMVERLQARGARLMGIGHRVPKRSRAGHSADTPATPTGVYTHFDQYGSHRHHRGRALIGCNKVTTDVNGLDKISISHYRWRFRECDSSGNDQWNGSWLHGSLAHLEGDPSLTVEHAHGHGLHHGHWYQSAFMAISTDDTESDWSAWSAPAKFSEAKQPPNPASPTGLSRSEQVGISWSDPPDPDNSSIRHRDIEGYRVQVASNTNFTTIVEDRYVGHANVFWHSVTSGARALRVCAFGAEGWVSDWVTHDGVAMQNTQPDGSHTSGSGSGAAGTVAPGTVATLAIADGSVTTPKLADGAVTTPKLADLAVTDAKTAAANKDGLAGVPSMRTLGAGAQQAAAGNDDRIVNAVQVDEDNTHAAGTTNYFDKIRTKDRPADARHPDFAGGMSTAASDNAAALQAVLDYVKAGPEAVFPAGQYNLSSDSGGGSGSLKLNADAGGNYRGLLRGNGVERTILHANTDAAAQLIDGLTNFTLAGSVQGPNIFDIEFDLTNNPGMDAFPFQGMQKFQFERVKFRGGNRGFVGYNVRGTFEKIEALDMYGPAVYADASGVSAGGFLTVRDVNVQITSAKAAAIVAAGGQTAGIEVVGFWSGMLLDNCEVLRNPSLVNPTDILMQRGIYVHAATNPTGSQGQFVFATNCAVDGIDGPGLELDNVRDFWSTVNFWSSHVAQGYDAVKVSAGKEHSFIGDWVAGAGINFLNASDRDMIEATKFACTDTAARGAIYKGDGTQLTRLKLPLDSNQFLPGVRVTNDTAWLDAATGYRYGGSRR